MLYQRLFWMVTQCRYLLCGHPLQPITTWGAKLGCHFFGKKITVLKVLLVAQKVGKPAQILVASLQHPGSLYCWLDVKNGFPWFFSDALSHHVELWTCPASCCSTYLRCLPYIIELWKVVAAATWPGLLQHCASKEEQPGGICLSHALKFIYNGIFSIHWIYPWLCSCVCMCVHVCVCVYVFW
jgi:hypothetical protein